MLPSHVVRDKFGTGKVIGGEIFHFSYNFTAGYDVKSAV